MFDAASLPELIEAISSAAATDVEHAHPDQLLTITHNLDRLRRFVDATETRVLAKLDRDGITDARYGLPTARWLAREADLPHGVAASRVGLAKKLHATLPETAAALERGEINVHHAHVMSRAANPRIADDIREIEAELLVLRKGCVSFDAWKADIGHIVNQLDADGGHTPDDLDPTRNRLRLTRGMSGELHLDGTFVGATAASIEEAINRAADTQWRLMTRDAALTNALETPTRPVVMALGLAELVRHGHQARTGGTASEPTADITITTNLTDPFRTGRTAYGARLSDQLMEFLACNAEFAALLANDLGVPLDLGRSHRYANRAQRRALLYRHGGTCAFPGCDVPIHRCDIHHITEWDQGGRTDLANLARS